eukprot:92307-Hanusia_phi.AAC.1
MIGSLRVIRDHRTPARPRVRPGGARRTVPASRRSLPPHDDSGARGPVPYGSTVRYPAWPGCTVVVHCSRTLPAWDTWPVGFKPKLQCALSHGASARDRRSGNRHGVEPVTIGSDPGTPGAR